MRGPLKSLGQNFLVDQNIVDRIVRSAALVPGDAVLEIGPGRGALTEQLIRQAGRLLLIEYDHALAAAHSELYRENPAVTVVDGDILAVDLSALLAGQSGWKVIANLPYNISTQVLFRLLEVRERLSQMVLMLQKEVGDRLVAPPDCGDYGITTVLLGLWFDIRREFIVPPGCFHPRPKVDSAVMRFVPLPQARVEVGDEALFRRVVKAAFAMRRKTLANCLKHADLPVPEGIDRLLEQCGIDGRRRGETLSLDEFARLSRQLSGV
ncbi:16S rRNA (adenine(1518)-N(6)/adenine(1519)-N(6))-dimethyltransferase RsmA [Geobacter sp. SVR]|uniref:16S rRNA (adenine(1518)-N(6)/adenine(1519)-N(6))- dimethyltransferase RsmA n=1 Tax=Geobacter sp. SVR TaxID=2495594 RepID=UPI001565830A|nr:16S rRNA (adenine(1518)-N(6)/adenine(1519)-N(6))-dimethyltransferase RsmA [Geobacter sp. SVR]